MKKILIIAGLLVLSFSLLAQDLPHKLTDKEKEILKTYQPKKSNLGFINPPSKPVRTMAEWEELDGIMITWTSYTSILRQIVDHAQEEGIVYIVCTDSNTVKNFLTSGGVPLKNLKFILESFNSVWIRDYGPWCAYSDIIDSLYIIDWIYNRPRPLDDLIPSVFASHKNYPLYQMTTSPYNFVATGGNFMTDGQGTGFSSKLILNENPTKTEAEIDTMMKKFMGINRYIKMENLPYDDIHHIDMHMKLLDEETLLVGQYPPGVSDGPYIEANLQYVLNNFQTCYGKPYKVVRIPMPPDGQGRYPNNGGDYRTYTNSIIVNKTVIVPTYELQYDTTGLRIYREAMPGYNIVGVNCNQMIGANGAIHCITKEIGVKEPIYISHSKIRSVVNSGANGYEVKAFIKTKSGISNASVFWSADTSQGFNQIVMNQISVDTFSAYIPPQQLNTKIYYYISASSNSGRVVQKPLTSPKGAFQFVVDAIVPVELVSFYGEKIENGVKLSWITASEKNNLGYEVQKSLTQTLSEGEGLNAWRKIGFVNGKGTSGQVSSYSFIDNESVHGRVFYRLKQIDLDGTIKYSDVVEIEFTPMQFSLEQNYPNPFNPSTKIKFTIPQANSPLLGGARGGFVTLKVYDVLGNKVATLVDEYKPAGSYEVEFQSTVGSLQLASGVYYYQLRVGEFVKTKKMILLR